MKGISGAAPAAPATSGGDPQYNVKVDNKYDLIADGDDPFEAISRIEKVVKEKPDKSAKPAKKAEKAPAAKAPEKTTVTLAEKPVSTAPKKPDSAASDRPHSVRGGGAVRGARVPRGSGPPGAVVTATAEGDLKAGQNWADHMQEHQAPVAREMPPPRYDQPSSAGSGFSRGFGSRGGFRGRGFAPGGGQDGYFVSRGGRGGPRGGRGGRSGDAGDASGVGDAPGAPADGMPTDADQGVERSFDGAHRGGGYRGFRGGGGGFGGFRGGRGGFRGGPRGGAFGPRPVVEGDQGGFPAVPAGAGGEGMEVVPRRGKREFERHSGSDVTGVRAVDKREGAGAHNWGTMKDDMAGQMEAVEEGGAEFAPTGQQAGEGRKEGAVEGEVKDAAEAGDKKENEAGDANAEAEGLKTMTLDEYRAQSGVKLAQKPAINPRKPNEGTDNAQWKGLQRLKRDPAPVTEEEGDPAGDDHARKGRKAKEQTVTDIQIKYAEEPSTRGFGGRGRGRGRGGGGGGFDRPPQSARSFGGAGGRGARGDESLPHIGDERDFPSLGK